MPNKYLLGAFGFTLLLLLSLVVNESMTGYTINAPVNVDNDVNISVSSAKPGSMSFIIRFISSIFNNIKFDDGTINPPRTDDEPVEINDERPAGITIEPSKINTTGTRLREASEARCRNARVDMASCGLDAEIENKVREECEDEKNLILAQTEEQCSADVENNYQAGFEAGKSEIIERGQRSYIFNYDKGFSNCQEMCSRIRDDYGNLMTCAASLTISSCGIGIGGPGIDAGSCTSHGEDEVLCMCV